MYSAVTTNGSAEKSLWTVKKSSQSFWTNQLSGRLGNTLTRLIFENTFNFSGPLNYLHFNFLDCLPIQKEYPLMPSSLTVFSKVARCVRPVKLRTYKLWFTLSKICKVLISMSIKVSPTRKNICKLSTTSLVSGIMGKISGCDTLYLLLRLPAICLVSSVVLVLCSSSISDHSALVKCRSAAGQWHQIHAYVLVALSTPVHWARIFQSLLNNIQYQTWFHQLL